MSFEQNAGMLHRHDIVRFAVDNKQEGLYFANMLENAEAVVLESGVGCQILSK